MISGLIQWFDNVFLAPFPWAFLGSFLEYPYSLFQSIGL